jgi:hypothetical protein
MRGVTGTLGALLLLFFAADPVQAGSSRPPPVAFRDCLPPPVVRPAEILFACGDGSESFSVARWTHWTRRSARATGTAEINDCAPSCVDGHVRHVRAVVLLDRPRACGGQVLFTRLRLRFTKRAGGGQPMGSFTLCHV